MRRKFLFFFFEEGFLRFFKRYLTQFVVLLISTFLSVQLLILMKNITISKKRRDCLLRDLLTCDNDLLSFYHWLHYTSARDYQEAAPENDI